MTACRTSVTSAAVLLSVLCLLCAVEVTATKFEYKKKEEGKEKSADGKDKGRTRSADWKLLVDNLLTMMAGDKEFKRGLKEEIAKAAGSAMDYCSFAIVGCNAEGEMESLSIPDVDGHVNFLTIPDTVITVTFVRGLFSQPMDLSTLPRHVKTFRFEGSRFVSPGGQQTVLTLSPGNSGLQSFTCSNCGLSKVDGSSFPPLVNLDLSDNPLVFPTNIKVPTLQFLNISGCQVSITLKEWVKQLPSTLTVLDASRTGLTGPFEGELPPHLELLDLKNNSLQGGFDPSVLPRTVKRVDLSSNQLEGTVGDLKAFRELTELELNNNEFTDVLWEKLPAKIHSFSVSKNKLTGPLKFIPPTLTSLVVSHNHMSGPIVLEKLPASLATFDIQSNDFSGEIAFDALTPAARFVYLQNNKFTGKCDLTNLPVDLRRILVGGNQWHNPMPPR